MGRPWGEAVCRWSIRSVTAVALMVAALVASAPGGAADSADADGEPRLPTVVNAPGTWSDDEGEPGPVAAIGLADRTIPVGFFDARQTISYFATSALDGSSTWLDLPGLDPGREGLVGGVAVSPDGRWLGWVRTAKGHSIKGWSIRDTTTGQVRDLDVEGYDRVRPAMTDLAFSGDSRYLLTSFETPDQPRRGARGHQFVAWSLEDGTPIVLEEPGFYWLPNLGYAENGVVWSRNDEVYRADPGTGHREVVTLPRTVLMASWAPADAAFAYIGRDDRKKGAPPADERLYVGATASSAHRVVELPDTSPIGEALAWRDATHVVVGNFRRDMYVVDITDGSYETLDMAGAGEQINTPSLATGLWSKPLRPPAAPTGTTDARRAWRWAALMLFVALLAGGAFLLRRAGPDPSPATGVAGEGTVTAGDVRPSVDRVPTVAWAMASLFLAGQAVHLLARGANSSDLPWVMASMALSALVVRWFADGVLRARTVRLVVAWIVLSAATSLGLVALLLSGAQAGIADLLAYAFTVAQLTALGVFCSTEYFQACRRGTSVPRTALAPLLMIALATGLLGGLTAPPTRDATSTQVRVGL